MTQDEKKLFTKWMETRKPRTAFLFALTWAIIQATGVVCIILWLVGSEVALRCTIAWGLFFLLCYISAKQKIHKLTSEFERWWHGPHK